MGHAEDFNQLGSDRLILSLLERQEKEEGAGRRKRRIRRVKLLGGVKKGRPNACDYCGRGK